MIVRDKIFRTSVYDHFVFDPSQVDIQGWGSWHPLFDYCIKMIKPKLIIEVGTWKGASAITMAKSIKKYNMDCEIVCVDTWLGNWEHWIRPKFISDAESSLFDEWYNSLKIKNGYPTFYNTFLNNVISQNLQKYITPLPVPSFTGSIILKKILQDSKLKAGIIYIDGDHEYETVLADMQSYWDLLDDNGVMILDDFNLQNFPGVSKAVYKFVLDNNLFLWGERGKAIVSKDINSRFRTKIILDIPTKL